jgi:hypothetical protein
MGVLGPDPPQPDLIERLVERYEVLNQIYPDTHSKAALALAEALELLQLAQGHMMELAGRSTYFLPAEIEYHNSLTKRVGEFLQAQTDGPSRNAETPAPTPEAAD